MKGDRQIAETRAEEMSHLSIAEDMPQQMPAYLLEYNFCFHPGPKAFFRMALNWASRRRWGEESEAPGEGRSIKLTYSADEACIVPAVAQGLQEPIPGINLKVTAVAFGAEHLLVVCGDKGDTRGVR